MTTEISVPYGFEIFREDFSDKINTYVTFDSQKEFLKLAYENA
jgi:hypothetical protein